MIIIIIMLITVETEITRMDNAMVTGNLRLRLAVKLSGELLDPPKLW